MVLGALAGWALHGVWHRSFFARAHRRWTLGEVERRRVVARRLWMCERVVTAVLALRENPTNELMRQAVRKAQEAADEMEGGQP